MHYDIIYTCAYVCTYVQVPYHVLGTIVDLIIWTNLSTGALYGMDELEELWRYCNVVCTSVVSIREDWNYVCMHVHVVHVPITCMKGLTHFATSCYVYDIADVFSISPSLRP